VVFDLVAALLPAREREEMIRRRSVDPYPWSFWLGLGEFLVGGYAVGANALAYSRAASSEIATYVLEKMDPHALNDFSHRLAITESGALIWLTWALRPLTWLLVSIPLVGMAGMIAFGVSRDAVGEPIVWILLRVAQGVRRLLDRHAFRRRFGPERPDRLVREPGCDLVVLSSRAKLDWNELVTIEIGDRFFRLLRTEERRDRGWWAHAYVLAEADPNEVFRGLIRYQPPGVQTSSSR
jgi:hypothetical protein